MKTKINALVVDDSMEFTSSVKAVSYTHLLQLKNTGNYFLGKKILEI